MSVAGVSASSAVSSGPSPGASACCSSAASRATTGPTCPTTRSLATLDDWLAPHLTRARRAADLARVDLGSAISGLLRWPQPADLDRLAPTHVEVPSGSRIRVDYGVDPPVLPVRIQEVFGWTETPTVAGGRVPLVLHLLSPAGRPAQVTQDLAGFWDGAYRQVRAELRGRYPKHAWPDDPAHAEPTRGVRRRR